MINALKDRLRRERGRVYPVPLGEELALIRERCSHLPAHDKRSPEEIIGYDDDGVPA